MLCAILLLPTILLAGQIAQKDSSLSIFSKDHRLIRDFSLGYQPSAYAFDDTSGKLYVADRNGSGLLVYDVAGGVLLEKIAFDGQILSISHDQSRGRIFVLSGHQLEVLEDRTFQRTQAVKLSSSPLFLESDAANGILFVATSTPEIIAFHSDSLSEVARISDLESEAVAIQVDRNADRLFVLHKKWVSAYQLSTFLFRDYLRIEADPLRIQSDPIGGKLFVSLADDADSIAVFDSRTLQVEDWLWLKNRTYKNQKIDASSFQVDPLRGRAIFLDRNSSNWFSEDETSSQKIFASTLMPPGMTPSADIAVNENIDKGNQLVPNSKFDGFGNFIAAWADQDGNDGNLEGAFVRRFNSDLSPDGNEFSASKKKAGDQGSPAVGIASNGDYVVVWRDGSGTDGSDFGVFAQLYANGSSIPLLTNDLVVPNTTSGRQMMPWVDSRANGNFVVAWSGKKGDKRQTFTRRFDAAGNALGPEHQSNSESHGNTWAVQVDVNNSGKYVVVWRDDGDNGIRGRLYNADGSTVAANSFRAGPLKQGSVQTFAPFVAIKEDGSFIVVWKENSAGGVVGQVFNSNQVSQGPPFVITSKKSSEVDAPSIAIGLDGRFLVCWRDGGYAGGDEIAARWFDSNTNPPTPLGDDFVVPENPGGDEFESNVSSDPAGNFFVVWKDRGRSPTIYGRYLGVAPPPTPITVVSVLPSTSNRASSPVLIITGTGFEPGTTVSLNDAGIVVSAPTAITPVSITVPITINNSAFLGLHDVTVTVGTSSGTGNDLFEVKQSGSYPNPSVNSVNPDSGTQSSSLTVDINGSNFANHPATFVNLGSNIAVNNLTWISGSLLRANISIGAGATTGERDASVSNPGGSNGTCDNCFEVLFNPALFSDNFNDGNFNGWTPDNGTWDASSFSLVGLHSGKGTIVATGFGGCLNCSIEAEIKVGGEQNKTVSLVGWWVDKDNFVELKMDKKSDKWLLKQFSNGSSVAKQKYIDPAGILSFQFYKAKIDFNGTTFRVFLHGDPNPVIVMDAGAPVSSGKAAFLLKGTTGTIDNLLVLP